MASLKNASLLLALFAALACGRGEQSVSSESPAKPAESRGAAPADAQQQTAPGTDVGSTMPEYAAMSLDGSKFDLAAKRDKVVLLNIWATWCGPCREEIPQLQALHDRYASQGFEVVGVSVDESGPEPVRDFVKAQKMTYPIVLDAEGKLANILQTSVLPTSIIVDREGKVLWKKFGLVELRDKELIAAIEKAL